MNIRVSITKILLPELQHLIWRKIYDTCLAKLKTQTSRILWRLDWQEQYPFTIMEICTRNYNYYHNPSNFDWEICYRPGCSNVKQIEAYDEIVRERMMMRGDFGFKQIHKNVLIKRKKFKKN